MLRVSKPREMVINTVPTQSSKLYRNDKPLRDIIGEEMRRRIFSGDLVPGTRLTERDLAEQFSVSRLPVREALRMLLNERLVEYLPSRGVVVRMLDESQVSELFDIREALEVLASRQAANQIAGGADDILTETVRQARNAQAEGNPDATHEANCRFHDQMVSLSGNDLLESLLAPLLGRLHWLFRQITDFDQVVAEHETLCDAITSADPERAAALARAHVRTYRTLTMNYLF